MKPKLILSAAFLAVLVLSSNFLCLAQTSPCSPVLGVPKSLEGVTLMPGKYRLILVSTSGEKKGAVTNGDLILIAASKHDISPKNGKVAYEGENLANTPLYGSVSIDFTSVAAPVFDLSGTVDPVYPDVLVHVVDFRGIKRQPVVVIGSAGNRRDGVIALDGSGIGLFVQKIGDGGFAGIWDPWGIRLGGSGYFCEEIGDGFTFTMSMTSTGFRYRGLSPHKFTPMPGVHHRINPDRQLRCAPLPAGYAERSGPYIF